MLKNVWCLIKHVIQISETVLIYYLHIVFALLKPFNYFCDVHWVKPIEQTYYKEVLLKLSSTLKLRNFDIGMKMIAIALHHWYVQPLLAFHITFGVGYCFIHSKGNAKTRVLDKTNIVPTPYFLSTFIREL